MANRIELYTAVTLLLLFLPANQSAHIKLAYHGTEMQKMKTLGEAALKDLVNKTRGALRPHTGTDAAGCIKEAKKEDFLNCSLIHTFSSYFEEVVKLDGLKDDTQLHSKLNSIRQRVEHLHQSLCSNNTAEVCEAAFQDNELTLENLEKASSILVLFIQWFSKPMA